MLTKARPEFSRGRLRVDGASTDEADAAPLCEWNPFLDLTVSFDCFDGIAVSCRPAKF